MGWLKAEAPRTFLTSWWEPELKQQESMLGSSTPFSSMTSEDFNGRRTVFTSISSMLIGFGFGCALIWISGSGQQVAVQDPAIAMALSAMQPAMSMVEARAAKAAGAVLRNEPPFRRGLAAKGLMSTLNFAARNGFKTGCRGQLTCARAVGLFWGTQSGETEEVADMIAAEAGVESKDISKMSAGDLAGYDGLIVGTPTWNTGADEERSGTAWDELLEEIRSTDLCGKPVAVFGTGDSVSYGDNYRDAIEELHSTFAAAGAKMLGYVASDGYQHSESKSVSGDKFLGPPCDQDNEDDQSEDRVKAWVAQLKGEGMPL